MLSDGCVSPPPRAADGAPRWTPGSRESGHIAMQHTATYHSKLAEGQETYWSSFSTKQQSNVTCEEHMKKIHDTSQVEYFGLFVWLDDAKSLKCVYMSPCVQRHWRMKNEVEEKGRSQSERAREGVRDRESERERGHPRYDEWGGASRFSAAASLTSHTSAALLHTGF